MCTHINTTIATVTLHIDAQQRALRVGELLRNDFNNSGTLIL